jgi:hypothetical protein
MARFGGRIYAGGNFTSIDGEDRAWVAAVDAATGSVVDWHAQADATVHSLVATPDVLHLGGSFTRFGNFASPSHACFYREGVLSTPAPGDDAPLALTLVGLTPNPSRGSTVIEFALPTSTHVRLAVHDVQGRRVALVTQGRLPAGRHHATWSGRAERGLAPSGLYFVRLEALGKTVTRTLVRVR